MPKSPMAKASIDTRRSLTPRELATIRAALRLWIDTDVHQIPEACYAELTEDVGALSDADIRSLVYEFLTCSKVMVCRSSESTT